MHLSRRGKHNKYNSAAATLFTVTVSKQQAHDSPSGTSLRGTLLNESESLHQSSGRTQISILSRTRSAQLYLDTFSLHDARNSPDREWTKIHAQGKAHARVQ